MSKIALATAIVALTAAVPLTMGHAEEAQPLAPYLAPGAPLPPTGGTTTTTTTTETKPVPAPVPIPAATPAAQPPQTTVASGTTVTPDQGTTTPMQGTTTPTHAVFMHAGPSGQTPVIRTLQPGESLRILASAPGGWKQVETPAGSGWAFGSYLAPADSAVGVQQPAPPQEIIAR
jgi:hypothetical protein